MSGGTRAFLERAVRSARWHFEQTPLAVHHHLAALERQGRIWATMKLLDHEAAADGPLVSVITPTYQRPDRLALAIRSVLAQRHQRWEMVVVDDGSRTAGPVIAAAADPRVRLVEVDHGGPCRARNAGLDAARGEIVAYLDDDNQLDPGWLHAVVWAFARHPAADALYGARLIDDDDRVHGRPGPGWPWVQFEPFDRRRLEFANFTDMGVVAHRRGIAGARFDESLIEAGDWDFLLSITEARPPIELPAIALHYRTDETDRLSGVSPADIDIVRAKWARRRAERRRR